MSETNVKQQVREFYDQVGWQTLSNGQYQNMRYEDLRPVSREYIHRCHMRVARHIRPTGRYLLDAGSGPVQYPEYATYSQGYQKRVCLDISILALKEARKHLGDHALCVVGDVANLPFKANTFDGEVSLHTLHHLPVAEQEKAYHDLYRVLAPERSAVVVNGWTDSVLMRRANGLVRFMEGLGRLSLRLRGREVQPAKKNDTGSGQSSPQGTYIQKLDADTLRARLSPHMRIDIWVWRSVNVRWLRAVIHSALGGKLWLRLLYALEERYPRYFGEKGQYPLIVLHKSSS